MLGPEGGQVNEGMGVGNPPRRQLLQNLSALSTSVPAPSSSVDPSVSRRGTCDREIWTKPLVFAADAERTMGFALAFRSLFVRDRWIAGVNKEQQSG